LTQYIPKKHIIYFIILLALTSFTPSIFQSRCFPADFLSRERETGDLTQNESFYRKPVFYMSEVNKTKSGYIKLAWGLDSGSLVNEALTFELQESLDPMFKATRTIYSGPDYATFLSGLPDNVYYYRVRFIAEDNPGLSSWSDSIAVQVEHHSLKLTFLLFSLGFVVVTATFLLVIYGSLRTRQDKITF
jgi:hypothetical protein